MNKYDKEFKTFKEQKKLLQDIYNLKFINETEAEHYLANFPYYNIINGYQEYFRIDGKYNEITLEHLINIYLLDKSFLAIILKYITIVEDNFKHKMGYVISSKGYDYVSSKVYLDKSDKILYNKIPKSSVIDILKSTTKQPKYNPTLYYKENHNHIPIWILFKNIFFKNTIEYFKLLNSNIKIEIISLFNFYDSIHFNFNSNKKINGKKINDKKIEVFQNCLETLKEYRNCIVHNNKVFKYTVKKTISINLNLFKGDLIYVLKNDNHTSGDLYSCILSIILLLEHPLLISNFIIDLTNVLTLTSEDLVNTYLNMYSLPINFINILENVNEYFKKGEI